MMSSGELVGYALIGCCITPLILLAGWYILLILDNVVMATLNVADPRDDGSDEL
jgi:hypothetical protein